MRLDVLIPTLERPALCAAVCRVVVTELAEGDQLWVIDQSGPAAHAALRHALAELPRTTLLHSDTPGLPGARNLGLSRSDAPGVVFLDDDAVPLPGWLDAHRSQLASGLEMVAGRIVECRVAPNSLRLRNRLDRAGRVRTRLDSEAWGWVESPKGANMGFSRAALVRVGGFDRSYAGTSFLEEADVAAAIGGPCRYAPDAAVVHLSASSGGVRPGGATEGLGWRFRNTALYLRRHRGLPLAAPLIFGLIAMRAAWTQRDAHVLATLLGEARAGWALGADARQGMP